MDPALAKPFLEFLTAQRLFVDHVQIAAVTILLYDYLLMLDLEIAMIWRREWTYTTFIFILTRYIPFGYAYFVISSQMGLGMDPRSCYVSYSALSWLILAGVTLAEVILAIRTWAVWRRNFRVGLLLIAMHVSNLIVSCIFLRRFMNGFTYEQATYRGFRGCLVTISNGKESIMFIMLTVAGAIVFCLMVAAAVRAYRFGLTNEFANVVHRDAPQFYAFLMLLAFTNIAVMHGAPPQYRNLFPALQAVLHSVFTSRIIINIRVAGCRSRNEAATELHPRNIDGSWPMVFNRNEQLGEVFSHP